MKLFQFFTTIPLLTHILSSCIIETFLTLSKKRPPKEGRTLSFLKTIRDKTRRISFLCILILFITEILGQTSH